MSDDAARSDDSLPPWQLLPDDPVGFFGLQSGYDRKDLKRAYNALLRRYKPDKYPQEFQKLRAAFEQLDGELRYGQSHQPPVSRLDESRWNPSAQPPVDTTANQDCADQAARAHHSQPGGDPDVPQSSPAPKTLKERIESESLPSLYSELKQNPREPFDFYVLALLSDAVSEPKDLLFLQWLLKGVKAFPEHPALTQLLLAYFQEGDLPDDQLAEALVRLSQVVSTDRFYFLAEKLFDRLASTAPWLTVEETLDRCAANINDHNIRAKVVFTCHFIRRALWLAPVEKSQQMLAYVNHNYENLAGSLEYEQELNSLLLNYVQTRAPFVAKGPVAQMIDAALRKYCLDTDGRGDYEIVKVQAHIAQHPEQLFREFRLTPDEDMQLLIPWIWVSDEVEDRLETQEYPPKPERLMAATFQMLQQIDGNFPLTPIQFYNMADRGLPLAICLFLIMVVPSVLGAVFQKIWSPVPEYVTLVVFGTCIGLAAFYWFWLQRRTTALWMIKYLRNMIQKHYLNWWRSLIGRFFAATHFTYRDVDRAIDGLLETRRGELNISNWLPHFYSRDPALYVYATAVRFLR